MSCRRAQRQLARLQAEASALRRARGLGTAVRDRAGPGGRVFRRGAGRGARRRSDRGARAGSRQPLAQGLGRGSWPCRCPRVAGRSAMCRGAAGAAAEPGPNRRGRARAAAEACRRTLARPTPGRRDGRPLALGRPGPPAGGEGAATGLRQTTRRRRARVAGRGYARRRGAGRRSARRGPGTVAGAGKRDRGAGGARASSRSGARRCCNRRVEATALAAELNGWQGASGLEARSPRSGRPAGRRGPARELPATPPMSRAQPRSVRGGAASAAAAGPPIGPSGRAGPGAGPDGARRGEGRARPGPGMLERHRTAGREQALEGARIEPEGRARGRTGCGPGGAGRAEPASTEAAARLEAGRVQLTAAEHAAAATRAGRGRGGHAARTAARRLAAAEARTSSLDHG